MVIYQVKILFLIMALCSEMVEETGVSRENHHALATTMTNISRRK